MNTQTKPKPARRADNVVLIKATLPNLFKMWMNLLKPYHGLTAREQDLAAAFLMKRYNISKGMEDPDAVDNIVLGKESKADIRQQLGLSKQFFQICMTALRKAKFIENGHINLRFVPFISNPNTFELMFHFDIKDDEE